MAHRRQCRLATVCAGGSIIYIYRGNGYILELENVVSGVQSNMGIRQLPTCLTDTGINIKKNTKKQVVL